MKLVPVKDLFEVSYGTSLELNALEEQEGGVPFVSRSSQNNGVTARVAPLPGAKLIPAGVLSVALGGTPMSTFLQEEPFYSGRDVAYLVPKTPMTRDVLLFYATCLQANRYRFSYGRQANRSLPTLMVPALAEVPSWVGGGSNEKAGSLWSDLRDSRIQLAEPSRERLPTATWRLFTYESLFDISRGRGPRKSELDQSGGTPFVTATAQNNGRTGTTCRPACHPGNVITVNRNGSVGEAFYQPTPFCSTEDVHVFEPRFELTMELAIFFVTLIRQEMFRYNYGRKWGLERMKASTIRLPVTAAGKPDVQAMEALVRGLPSHALLCTV